MLKNYIYHFVAGMLTVLIFFSIESAAQQFPIGTFWVKDDSRERSDHYDQVRDAGINIVVGGAYGTSTLPTVLTDAENEQITLIIDRIYPDGSDSISWYGGGRSSTAGDDQVRAYRMEYELNGVLS